MKAFEKWFDKNCCQFFCSDLSCCDCKCNQQTTWKAALEWVLLQRENSAFGKDISSEVIKKELDGV